LLLDTFREVETPEGLALNLRCAGVVPRSMAWLLDLTIRTAVVWVLAMSLAALGDAGMGVVMIAMFLVFWGYPIAFEVLNDGQTPGKRMLGLRVINDNGTPVTWVPSIVRNLIRVVDMMPMLYGFGLVCALVDPSARRLGDLAAGTLVVYVEKPAPSHMAPPVPPVPSPLPLRLDEQGAIVAFAERSQQMTVERQTELAELLSPLTGSHGENAVRRLLGMANHLLGRR
jgi:uncharacterized RDD family membrane protein YckC